MNHATTELFFDDLEVPVEHARRRGRARASGICIDGLNAERILIAAECVGDGRWFIERATKYANERVVFGRPIGQNQGVQFPIARAHVNIEAADLMRIRAAELFDRGEPCGAEANMAKLLAADASWEAANVDGADVRRLRVCRGLRHRAQVPRDAPVSGRADLDEPDPDVRRRTCAGSAALVLKCTALSGRHRRLDRAGRRGAVRDAAARRSRRARDQDRAAGRRRLRARLRHHRQGAVELLRVAQPIEGVADARSQAARRAGGAGAAARSGRRLRAEPRARRRRSARHLRGDDLRARQPKLIVCTISGYGTSGPVRGPEGVRSARAERGRAAVGDRHRRRAEPRRHLRRRHRRRDVRVFRHPRGAVARASSGEGRHRGGVAVRRARRVDGRAGVLHRVRRHAAARTGAAHATIAPYELFVTRDEVEICLAIQNAREWTRFCAEVLGRPEAGAGSPLRDEPGARPPSRRAPHDRRGCRRRR